MSCSDSGCSGSVIVCTGLSKLMRGNLRNESDETSDEAGNNEVGEVYMVRDVAWGS